MTLFIITIFSIYLWLFFKWERKLYISRDTPVFLFFIGNIPVLVLYYIFSGYLHYHPLLNETILWLIFGIVIFSFPAIIINLCIKTKKDNKGIAIKPTNAIIYMLSMAISLYMLYSVFQIGIENIGNEEIALDYGGRGLGGHLLVLQILLLTQMLVHRSINIFVHLTIILMALASIIFYQVKIWIFTPFIVALMIRVFLKDLRISINKITLGGIFIFILFVVAYLPSFNYELSQETRVFLFDHFIKYGFAGIGGFNEALIKDLPIGQNPLSGIPSFIMLFINTKYKVDYNYNYLIINDVNEEYTNVYTFFGQQYLFTGLPLAIVYMLIISLLSYVVYYIHLRSRNYWYNTAYYFWTLGLILAFFGNYYYLLNIYELVLYCYTIGFFIPRIKRLIRYA